MNLMYGEIIFTERIHSRAIESEFDESPHRAIFRLVPTWKEARLPFHRHG
jgi:hypothetical protein